MLLIGILDTILKLLSKNLHLGIKCKLSSSATLKCEYELEQYEHNNTSYFSKHASVDVVVNITVNGPAVKLGQITCL